MEIETVNSILQRAGAIAQHQEEIKKLRGENFNLFAIFALESRENEGHSAFLSELLNPRGSHLQGDIFLQHFLETVGYSGPFEPQSARLRVEETIGKRNDADRTGGRIDIYLCDGQGQTISIENKIYAADQLNQIERYVNHNKGKNTVYYLTLEGSPASADSKGKLREGEDYHCISYKQSILTWLEKCLKESVEQPILRESIRQYIIIIKKLTNQLTDHHMAEKMRKLIFNNYSAAKLIQSHVPEVELEAVTKFMKELRERIAQVLKDGWTITLDDDLTRSWKGIAIEYQDWAGICVRFQGEPKLIAGESIYGIVAHNITWDRNEINRKLATASLLKDQYRSSAYWPCYYKIDLFNMENIPCLFDETNSKREELMKDVLDRLIQLSQVSKVPLSGIKKIGAES